MKKFRHKIYWTFNIVVALLLIISHFSSYLSPEVFWPAAFLSFTYPLLLIINILFIAWWFFKDFKRALLSIIFITLTYSSLSHLFPVNFSSPPKTSDAASKIVLTSWNVRLFDLYNWSKNNETKNKMFDYLVKRNSDVICFQEFFHQNKKNSPFITKDILTEILKAKEIHQEYTTKAIDDQYFGSATFSSYPIVKRGRIDFGDAPSNICLYTDVLIDSDTVRIYNLHLASIRLSNEDHKFIEEISENNKSVKLQSGSLKIFSRMKKAFSLRAKQVGLIAQNISVCEHPVIVMGDFNDTPNSYTYRQLTKNLTDIHNQLNSGIGGTYSGFGNIFRIDYILVSEEITAKSLVVNKLKYSDHYPLEAILTINR